MNKSVLVGNLTKDPEIRVTNGDISVCTFMLAVNRPFSNSQGEREADFIPIVVWRQQAENCSKYLQKGSKVAVSGSIRTRTYEAQDGTKRYTTEVVADEVQFLSTKGTSEGHVQGKTIDAPAMEIVVEEDLPF